MVISKKYDTETTIIMKDKIRKWLDKQGYPLEMRVASTLQQKSFTVVQSEYYVDPESGDSREIDVACYLQDKSSNVLLRVLLIIECKRSLEKPWLLFTSNKIVLPNPSRIIQRAANRLGKKFLTQICKQKEIQGLDIFKLPERSAYGVTQAFTSGKDVCYAAVTSVSKAALSTVTELDEKEKGSLHKGRKLCLIVLPIIVVDGCLFEVFLENGSEVVLNEIDHGMLLLRNPIIGIPHTIINIVSVGVFDKFASDCFRSITQLFSLVNQDQSFYLRMGV